MKQLQINILLLAILLVFSACSSDTTIPTLQATPDSPTEDAGSGFDPDLGGDGDTDTQPTPTQESGVGGDTDTESGARGTGFTAQITGGGIASVADGGTYSCNIAGHRIASGVSEAPNITLTIPVEDPIATHSFIGVDADGTATAVVTLGSVDATYTQVTGGTLTVDEVPAGAGDFVSGSFDFTIADASGDEIGVRGDFAFETSGTAYCAS